MIGKPKRVKKSAKSMFEFLWKLSSEVVDSSGVNNYLQGKFLRFCGGYVGKLLIPEKFIIICKFPQAKINIGGGVGGALFGTDRGHT